MDELDALISVQLSTEPTGAATVKISGELDMSNIDALETEVAPALARQPPRLVVDVADLRFADSSAIALWVRWAGLVDEFELRDPSPLLRRVIGAMGLAGKLPMTP